MSKFKEYMEMIDEKKAKKPLYTIRSSMSAQSSRLQAAMKEMNNEMLQDAMLKLFEVKEQPEQAIGMIEDVSKLYEKSLKAYAALNELCREASDQLGKVE